MESDHHLIHGRSRRELLVVAAALAAGGGVALAASSAGGGAAPARPARRSTRSTTVSTTIAAAETDIVLLNSLIELERTEIAAYTAAIPTLRGENRQAALSMMSQEGQHAAALERAVRDLGSTPIVASAPAYYSAGFPTLLNTREALAFLLEIERQTVSSYLEGVAQISGEDVRITVAAVLTAEAEHLAVILGGLGRPQLSIPALAPAPSPS